MAQALRFGTHHLPATGTISYLRMSAAASARISPAAKCRPGHIFGDAPKDRYDVARGPSLPPIEDDDGFSVSASPPLPGPLLELLLKRNGSNPPARVPQTASSLFTAGAKGSLPLVERIDVNLANEYSNDEIVRIQFPALEDNWVIPGSDGRKFELGYVKWEGQKRVWGASYRGRLGMDKALDILAESAVHT